MKTTTSFPAWETVWDMRRYVVRILLYFTKSTFLNQRSRHESLTLFLDLKYLRLWSRSYRARLESDIKCVLRYSKSWHILLNILKRRVWIFLSSLLAVYTVRCFAEEVQSQELTHLSEGPLHCPTESPDKIVNTKITASMTDYLVKTSSRAQQGVDQVFHVWNL